MEYCKVSPLFPVDRCPWFPLVKLKKVQNKLESSYPVPKVRLGMKGS